jgi:phage gp36-like protein
MSWQTLSDLEVLAELTPAEKRSIDTLLGGDSLGPIVANTVSLVRGYIVAGGYTIGQDGTLPEGLKSDAIAIARWRLLVALPQNAGLQTESRKAAYTEAMDKLKLVAAGKFGVEVPENAATTIADSTGPSFDTPTRTWTKEEQDGI